MQQKGKYLRSEINREFIVLEDGNGWKLSFIGRWPIPASGHCQYLSITYFRFNPRIESILLWRSESQRNEAMRQSANLMEFYFSGKSFKTLLNSATNSSMNAHLTKIIIPKEINTQLQQKTKKSANRKFPENLRVVELET